MLVAGHGDLPGRGPQELVARYFLNEVWVFGAQKLYTARELRIVVTDIRQLLLRDCQSRLCVRQRQETSRSPNKVIAEIESSCGADRRHHKSAKKPCHAASDSHG